MSKPLQFKNTTLFTLAHPDDEQLVSAAIVEAIKQGRTAILYYASLGEGGMTGGLCSHAELGGLRSLELRESVRILGVGDSFFRTSSVKELEFWFNMGRSCTIQLDHGDGCLHNQVEQLTQELHELMEIVQPDQVFTLPPSGVTDHPDHKAVQRATSVAVRTYRATLERDVELYYRVIPAGSNGIIDVLEDPEQPTHVVSVSEWHRERMFRSMNAHRTQKEAMSTIFPALREGDPSLLWSIEYYSMTT